MTLDKNLKWGIIFGATTLAGIVTSVSGLVFDCPGDTGLITGGSFLTGYNLPYAIRYLHAYSSRGKGENQEEENGS